MAFLVRRPAGRWEIRESVHTDAGPRARSLASFRTLTPDVLAKAEERARRPFDVDAIVESAHDAGLPVDEPQVDRAARVLLREMAGGSHPKPGLGRLLADRLSAGRSADPGGIADWFGATDEARGDALRQLLDLGDRLPKRRRGALTFPGLKASPAGSRG